jgi:hypothetical protein
VTIGTFATQLALRLSVIATLLASTAAVSYSATHWEQSSSGTEASSTATSTATVHR